VTFKQKSNISKSSSGKIISNEKLISSILK
jgi:hypothetical protein